MKKLLDIYAKIQKEPDDEKRHRLVHDAVRVHIEEGPFHLGTTGQVPQRGMRNVPRTGILGPWAVTQPATSFSEQYFFDRVTAATQQARRP
jgi:peptide/nickel transport system substrate-binding protein